MDGLVLVAYASNHGSTREIAEAISGSLEKAGLRAHLRPAIEVDDLDGYDAVVLGAPIYMGRWQRHAHAFLRRHRSALAERPLAVFALGPLHDDPKEWSEARAQLDTALARHERRAARGRALRRADRPVASALPVLEDAGSAMRRGLGCDRRRWGEALPELLGVASPAARPTPAVGLARSRDARSPEPGDTPNGGSRRPEPCSSEPEPFPRTRDARAVSRRGP